MKDSDISGNVQVPALRRLVQRLRSYVFALVLAVVCFACIAITEMLLPALMKPLLDNGFAGTHPDYVWKAPLVIVGIFVVRGIFTFTSHYVLAWVSNRMLLELRSEMFSQLLKLPDTYFKRTPASETLNRFLGDAQNALSLAAETASLAVRDTFVIVALLGYLFYLNWQLTFVALAIIPSAAIITRLFAKRMTIIARSTQEMNIELTQSVLEGNDAQRVIKLYGGYDYEKSRFDNVNARLRRLAMRNVIAGAATVPTTQIIAAIGVAIVVAIALTQATGMQSSQSMTVGGFASFVTAMLQMLAPLKQLANLNGPYARMKAAAENVFRFLDHEPELDTGMKRLDAAAGEIDFDDIHKYYESTEQNALAGVSMHIAAGEKIAFVGRSGSGKTTLVSLLPRFIEPTSGRIRLDGVDIRDLSLASLRAQISMVSQDVVLFDDTIRENVAYGSKSNPSEDAIRSAIDAANLGSFVKQLPDGLDTRIGEKGGRLSGGQRQRIAIARAFIKDAPILILDEATSALDNESERLVQESIERLMAGRTTLVIAHRLSTIQNADRIVVLDHGRIVEIGTHQELLAKGGVYAALHALQFSEITS